jgi:hypothetical protein
VTGRREWGALAALVLVSTALRTWAAVQVPVPWIAPDEMVYGLLGRSLYAHGTLAILGGPTPFYSLLTPVVAGAGLLASYHTLQGLQAFVMSLAAVPVYLWGRSLVSRRAALAAAALAVAIPGLLYAGLIMTEVVFYPLFVLVAWAGAEAIARPSRRTTILLLVAFVAVCATRIQAIVVVPALVTAALADAWLARSWGRLRAQLPAAAGIAALVLVWLGYRLGSGSGTLGGYEVLASTSFSVGGAAKFVLYHAASVLILCGLFPAAAVAVMLVHAARRGEPDARVRAYLAVAASLTVWLVVEVGVFASRYSGRIVERNLIGLAPVLFVGLVLWLERGPCGGRILRAAVALVALVVLVLLPVDRYVNIYGTHDAPSLVPLYQFSRATSLDALTRVYPAVVGVLAIAFAFLPWRRLRWLPVALLVVFVGASVLASRFTAEQARAQKRAFLGPDPSWVDHSVGRRAAYLYDGEPSWNGVWQTVFWNDHIDRVYDLGQVEIPGPLPQTRVRIRPDGIVDLPGKQPKYAVASTWMELAGKPKGRVEQHGLSQAGLVAWKIHRPLRIVSRTSGLQLNGDIYANDFGRLVAYRCGDGVFRMTLLPKQPGIVQIRVNGKLVRELKVGQEPSVHVDLPVHAPSCTLEVHPNVLLGTTQFTFERS